MSFCCEVLPVPCLTRLERAPTSCASLGLLSSRSQKHRYAKTFKGELKFIHKSLFTKLEECYCISEQSCIKPSVAPGGATQNLINWLGLKTSLKMKNSEVELEISYPTRPM